MPLLGSNLMFFSTWELSMKQVPALTSLRFFGAICVIFSHMGIYVLFKSWGLGQYYVLVSGSTGVQLFFVLSGFLITSLAIKELSVSGGFSFRKFFIRRALRLFPLYYLAVLVIFALDQAGFVGGSSVSYIYALTYTYNFIPRADYFSILGSFHTLATEEQFYLFFGLTVGVLSFFGRRILMFFFPMILFALLVFLDDLRPLFSAHDRSHFTGRWVLFASKAILLGCIGGVIYSSGMFARFIQLLEKNVSIYKSFGVGLLYFFLYFHLGQVEQYDVVKMSMGFLCLIFYLCIFQDSTLSRILSWGPLVYLGVVSYGLYVWQSVFHGTGPGTHWLGDPFLSFGLVFLASVVSHEFYEKRFLKLKEKFR